MRWSSCPQRGDDDQRTPVSGADAVPAGERDAQGVYQPVEYLLGNGQAAVFLAVVTAAVVGVGVVLFSRRDLH